jgi:single-stranded DNA-binding protein
MINFILIEGYCYNITKREDIHLIKFDFVSWLNRKSKRGQRLRLSVEFWNQDRIVEFLEEGGKYIVSGLLKEFEYEGKDGNIKRKYIIEGKEVKQLIKIKSKDEEE